MIERFHNNMNQENMQLDILPTLTESEVVLKAGFSEAPRCCVFEEPLANQNPDAML